MKRTLQAFMATAAVIAGMAMLSSCHSMIFDDEGDCTPRYHVPFTFTMNMLGSDAFASQVTGVTIYVFDKSGHLVLEQSDAGPQLSEPGYRMNVDLQPGTYDILAWCTGTSPVDEHTAFTIGSGDVPADFGATLPLSGVAGGLYSDLDITPLYHGYVENVVCRASDYGDIDLPAIDLTKDTNLLKILLENRDGREMKPSDFTISITGDNSEMDYMNNPFGTLGFEYRPWSITPVQSDRSVARETLTQATGLFAECTMGRLMTDRAQRLVITRNTDGATVVSLDLISTLLMVKGNYNRHYPNQEYLDRMDQHTMIFLLNDDLSWYTAGGVNINGWTVVPPQDQPL